MRAIGGTSHRRAITVWVAACGLAWALVPAPTATATAFKAPDPGGNERALVPVPPLHGKFFGYHEYAFDSGGDWSASDAARIAAGGGANSLRFTINWSDVEPRRDLWREGSWQRFERIYRAGLARGIRPLITVSTAPPWARDPLLPQLCFLERGCEYPPARSKYGEWQEFISEVARRFPRAAAIEIWNEPNLQSFWKPAPDPERYAELVTYAYRAVKNVSPRINVLAGAMAPFRQTRTDSSEGPRAISMSEFLTRAYQAEPGIAKHIDGISVHHTTQNLNYGKNSLLGRILADIRGVRNAFGDRRLPIWISEFGLSTTGTDAFTARQQRNGLLRAYRRLMTIPDVRGFYIHTLSDRLDLPPNDHNHGYGVVASTPDGGFVPKGSFCAFARRTSPAKPAGGCSPLPLARGSACGRALVKVIGGLVGQHGSAARKLRKRYARLATKCIPASRAIHSLVRRIVRAVPAVRALLRPQLRRLEARSAPCRSKLRKLERKIARAEGAELRSHLTRRHERARRACRA